jgi:hypothetical protein
MKIRPSYDTTPLMAFSRPEKVTLPESDSDFVCCTKVASMSSSTIKERIGVMCKMFVSLLSVKLAEERDSTQMCLV